MKVSLAKSGVVVFAYGQQLAKGMIQALPLRITYSLAYSLGVVLLLAGSVAEANSSSGNDLLMYMGGHNSCASQATGGTGPKGMAVFQQKLAPLLAAYEGSKGKPLHWVLSCFRGDEIYYYLSSSESKLHRSPDFAKEVFFEAIKKLIAAKDIKHLFVLGHSHGGWLAMKAMLDLNAQLQAASHLVTIDPISRLNCTPADPRECTLFPTDISWRERLLLRQHNKHWDHYYQRATSYLHSAPTAEAWRNIKSSNSHKEIRNEPLIWQRLERWLGMENDSSI